MPATNARTATNKATNKNAVFIAGDIAGNREHYANWKATDWLDTLKYFRDEHAAEIRFIHSRKSGILQVVSFPGQVDSEGKVFTLSVVPYSGRIQAHYRHPETGERATQYDEVTCPETGKPLNINNVGVNPDGAMRHIPRTWEQTTNGQDNSDAKKTADRPVPNIL